MRVEGAPILTIAVNQAQDEAANEVLSEHDQYLLEQIEKGQLKLSPIHQVKFKITKKILFININSCYYLIYYLDIDSYKSIYSDIN